MSRIGKHPVIVPAGVTVEIDGHTVKVTGPKGTLERTFTPSTTLSLEDGQVKV
ncbi:MAG: 50S ribosomal protein L6, partial [Atopobiaceae bacterium]|nr:50S ribosomal protein L6 [Atopobiaceae bacterium]